jgi:hypothetical protein
MRSNQVHIDSPCHESWETMDGDAERRFCGVCQKDVHNLSAMRLDDARALLRESQGSNLCVRYSAESDGTLRFRDLVPAARLTRGLVRSAFAAALLAACSPTVEGPIADLGDVVIESIRAATTPTSDGGCDYTTGPFTTFHLAPGHVLCRSTGHDALALPPAPSSPPELPPNIPPNIPPSTPPSIPLAEPDPIDLPRMGLAIAVPEPIEPFVPCDPKPTFAPPPPPNFAPPRRASSAWETSPRLRRRWVASLREPPPQDPGFAPPPPETPASPRLRPRAPASPRPRRRTRSTSRSWARSAPRAPSPSAWVASPPRIASASVVIRSPAPGPS